MTLYKLLNICLIILVFTCSKLVTRDFILEFKVASLLPTNDLFRNSYHHGLPIFGPELTAQLHQNWYGFAQINYAQSNGRYLGICNDTKLRVMPINLGLKYLLPVHRKIDFYLGLGFAADYLHTKNTRGQVTASQSSWSIGGISKIGAYFDLPHHFLLDLFFDYNFAKTDPSDFYGHTTTPTKVNLNSGALGIGLGYRF